MTRYVSDPVRRFVARRADYLCEYCLIHEADTFFGCEVEHIIGIKHGGSSATDNLAFACFYCNRHKGSDVGSVHPHTHQFVRFFHPRLDRWSAHFDLDGMSIEGVTEVGEATVRILRMNDPDRLLERAALIVVQRYPSPSALKRINPR